MTEARHQPSGTGFRATSSRTLWEADNVFAEQVGFSPTVEPAARVASSFLA